MKRIALVIGCVGVVLPACTGGPSRITIAMTVPTSDTAFFEVLVSAARQEARRQGAALVVSNAGNDDARQARDVDRLVEQGVDAIVIDAVGGRSVVRAAQRAREADIPLIAVGDVVAGTSPTTSIVSENVVAGRIAAEYLFFRMGGTGTAAAILPSGAGPASREVERGFQEIAARTPTVTLAERRSSPVAAAGAASVASRMFEEIPDLEGVFAGTDEIALGVVQAARRLGVLGRVMVVAVGGTARALAAIRVERLEGVVRTDPHELGRLAVAAAVRAAHGNPVPRRQVVDVTLVTEDNVKRFLP